ncbi:16S rRNA (cytosine(1402)-N(4))-methyltransferase RsmH [Thiospirochaeta perfilievii]|uniref:Ribosomal RNA small subunit methyltransferase H n=1 Tax=Thiospirochaeta perfilievii TaxID=252967 RepID=A0A5C1Q9H4_9SPIO|nr:16S rRNA (cytosine(1402)-N(4))-methyltransferase RsmH [Thiospirochaeta perfilievii]QEN03750.1 16S rRNA (cytosine(1402)-N(4))-methyltransferase RsmH [Thiospirochaeta perfilievii]
MDIVHYSVLMDEVLGFLKPSAPDQLLVDGTMGEGGHSNMFLTNFPTMKVIGIDADHVIQGVAKERLAPFGDRVNFENTWFNEFFENFDNYNYERPDRILLDLGISVFHYEKSGRGFTFQKNEPLDMRLNPNTVESARDIVNTYDETTLANLIYDFSDEKLSRKIARKICAQREIKPIETTDELAYIVRGCFAPDKRHGKTHPATRTFQALRIAVNSELYRLDRVLEDALRILKPGGRFGIITFHSLEDRAVKRFFQDRAKKCICPDNYPRCLCGGKPEVKRLTKKPIGPTEEEIKLNPPSRSAKLRVIEKLTEAREVMG